MAEHISVDLWEFIKISRKYKAALVADKQIIRDLYTIIPIVGVYTSVRAE